MNKESKRIFIQCFPFPTVVSLKYMQHMAIQMPGSSTTNTQYARSELLERFS